MKRVYLVSVSGGKDSTAAWAWMEEHYADKGEIVPYFADTGWEHELTYEYLDYLEDRFGKKIIRIKTEKYEGFEDMCIKRKMFPSRTKRICTQELKTFPSRKFIKQYQAMGLKVVNVVGVRQEESEKRKGEQKWKTSFIFDPNKKNKKPYRRAKAEHVTVLQPIFDWTIHQVYEYLKENNIKMNPLYFMGYSRVGCFPCIQAKVAEVGMIDDERTERISNLEKKVTEAAGARRVFWQKDAEMHNPVSFAKQNAKRKYNTLGLDLGCINHLGKCE